MRFILAAALILASLPLLLLGCVVINERVADITPTPSTSREGLHWAKMPVHYCIVDDDSGFVSVDKLHDLAARAFDAWGVNAIDDGDCRGPMRTDDRVNSIGWSDLDGDDPTVHQAGETFITYDQCRTCKRPEITEADMRIDVDPPRGMRNERCLYTTILHEVGHFLGLPHLDAPAMMAPVQTNCPQELTDADFLALSELYP